jgi:hypothetical protein
MQAEFVASIGEDDPDICGKVGERVARTSPASSGVNEATSIGMDETSEEELGCSLDQSLLPACEFDPSEMLLAWSVLGKKARPSLGVGIHLHIARKA